MVTLDELLHPITPAQFRAEYDGRKPLHIPAEAGGRKHEIFGWADLNDLLNRDAVWSAGALRLMRDHVAVPTEQFCQTVHTPAGPVLRPTPAKVEIFLSAGASLVANDMLHMHAPLTRIGRTLSQTFAAQIGANVYCSFKGVRAFGTHFDNHDVLVVHTEGEKVWNLYQSRALNPIDPVADTVETRLWFEKNRGPVIQEVTMRAGDVLYLPRGWYHDALAGDGGSLHVTFSINPLYGRILLSLLDNAAMQNPDFREWLPPANLDGGKPLRARLAELGQMLATLAASPAFADEVAMAQERLVPRPASFNLPERKPITLYRTTGRAFPQAPTQLRVVYEWAMAERQFAIEDMIAEFDFVSEADVRAGVVAAEQSGALQRV